MKGGFFNMPLVEFKEKNSRSIKSRTLSNVQMELIKLYSTDLEYDDLMEVKKILANHFAQKAIILLEYEEIISDKYSAL